MKQLETQNSKEIIVNTSTGEAYISQRRAAEKLGVASTTLQAYIDRHLRTVNHDTKQGLSSEIFSLCVQYFALDSRVATQEAKELLRMISQAGAKAYLYHEAGYTITATPSTPRSAIELAKQTVAQAKESVAQAQAMLALIENQAVLEAVVEHKKEITNESDYYIPAQRIKDAHPTAKINLMALMKASADLELPPIKQWSLYKTLQTNAYHLEVWQKVHPELMEVVA